MSKNHFQQIQKHHDFARAGILKTRSGTVRTPFFMPVATRGSVKGLTASEVTTTGAQVLLANAYHLHLQPGESRINGLGGLHVFMNWPGPILTDSGGFQIYSLSRVRKITEDGVKFNDPSSGKSVFISPEKSIQIQIALGSDIIMAFDDLTGLDEQAKTRTTEAVERTHRWLIRCIAEFNKLTNKLPPAKRPLLFGIVQGGLDKKLRKFSLEFVQSQNIDGIAIGGLSVGEPRTELYRMLDFLAPLYDPAKVHYLMGVGDPTDVRYAITRGVDMTDCVLPTRNARHGSVWIKGDKKLNLNNQQFANYPGPIDKNCGCNTCKSGYSRAFLRHQFKAADPLAGTLATVHNLWNLNKIFKEYQGKNK